MRRPGRKELHGMFGKFGGFQRFSASQAKTRLQSSDRKARLVITAVVSIAVLFWASMGATALTAHQLFGDLPSRQSVVSVTQMARSSVLYDVKGHPAFT